MFASGDRLTHTHTVIIIWGLVTVVQEIDFLVYIQSPLIFVKTKKINYIAVFQRIVVSLFHYVTLLGLKF